MVTISLETFIQTLDIIVSEVVMITLEQTKRYDKMELEQLEDLYTATIRSIRRTDDAQSQINLNSKLNYLYSVIKEKKK